MPSHFDNPRSFTRKSSYSKSLTRWPAFLLLTLILGLFVSCRKSDATTRDEVTQNKDSKAQHRQDQFKRTKSIVDANGGRIKTSDNDETAITAIDFSNCHTVDSKIIAELGKIPTLTSLLLLDTRFDETGIPYLSQFPNLQTLDVKGASISNEALDNFPPLRDLTFLGLSGTQITDAGLKKIPDLDLPNLKFLQLNFTDTSDEAKDELTKRCPGLKIVL